jgi:hypothetical protein
MTDQGYQTDVIRKGPDVNKRYRNVRPYDLDRYPEERPAPPGHPAIYERASLYEPSADPEDRQDYYWTDPEARTRLRVHRDEPADPELEALYKPTPRQQARAQARRAEWAQMEAELYDYRVLRARLAHTDQTGAVTATTAWLDAAIQRLETELRARAQAVGLAETQPPTPPQGYHYETRNNRELLFPDETPLPPLVLRPQPQPLQPVERAREISVQDVRATAEIDVGDTAQQPERAEPSPPLARAFSDGVRGQLEAARQRRLRSSFSPSAGQILLWPEWNSHDSTKCPIRPVSTA